jgi:hypothetical protein
LAGFTRGLEQFTVGEFVGGTTHLTAYAQSRFKEPAWAYSYQPAAQRWLDLARQFEDAKRKAAAAVKAGKVADARQALQEFMNQSPGFFKIHVEKHLSTLPAK